MYIVYFAYAVLQWKACETDGRVGKAASHHDSCVYCVERGTKNSSFPLDSKL